MVFSCVAFSHACSRLGSATGNRARQVVDEGRQRAIVVQKRGFPDAVVWNPWIDKAAGMADFGDDEYKVWPSLPESPSC